MFVYYPMVDTFITGRTEDGFKKDPHTRVLFVEGAKRLGSYLLNVVFAFMHRGFFLNVALHSRGQQAFRTKGT